MGAGGGPERGRGERPGTPPPPPADGGAAGVSSRPADEGAAGAPSAPARPSTPGLPITEDHPVVRDDAPAPPPPTAATGEGAPRPPDSKIFLKDRQKGLIRTFIDEVLNAHDPSALERFITPDFADGTPEPGFEDDRRGFRDWLQAVFAGFPDMRWEASLMLYEEDTVVVRLTAMGTHLGTFRGVAATGRPVRMEAVHIVGLRDGRMASHFRISDELSLMEQITRPV